MATKKKAADQPQAPTPELTAEWKTEAGALRAEIASLKKGNGDADVIAGLVDRMTAIEGRLVETRETVIQLPGGGIVQAPAEKPAPAATAQPKEKTPEKKPEKGGYFWE